MSYPNALFLVRHAEVETRFHRVFSGRLDIDLSPEGQNQAVALSDYLQKQSLHTIYASPMRRVQETLKPLLSRGFTQVTLPDLREIDFGDWTGLAWDDVRHKFQVSAFEWLDQLDCAAIPNAECGRTLRTRIEPCLLQIIQAHSG